MQREPQVSAEELLWWRSALLNEGVDRDAVMQHDGTNSIGGPTEQYCGCTPGANSESLGERHSPRLRVIALLDSILLVASFELNSV